MNNVATSFLRARKKEFSWVHSLLNEQKYRPDVIEAQLSHGD
jgi:hypothetical protein